MSRLSAKYSGKIGLAELGELIGLLHDLGKYSAEFQAYLRSAEGLIDPDADDYVNASLMKGKVDHSTAGAQYLWARLSRQSGLSPFIAQLASLCIVSHHSGLIDCLAAGGERFGENVLSRRMDKSDFKTHLNEVNVSADTEILSRVDELLSMESLIEGVRSIGVSIAQKNHQFPIGAQQHYGLLVRMLFSCLIDADRTDTADFEKTGGAMLRQHGEYSQWGELLLRLEAKIGGLENRRPIDALRQEISMQCQAAASRPKGTYTLTVPTGGGKTLASLRFALEHAAARNLDRIIYVIPYTSIIDQNANVAREALEINAEERGRIVLECHSNLLPEAQTWQEKILSENWDAPVIYTTMVQFLEVLFSGGTRGARRMHQLARSVLIFDEIQTLPLRCVHLFNNALNFLTEQCDSTVVLCTATQPLLHQVCEKRGAIRLAPDSEIVANPGEVFDQLKRVSVEDLRRPEGWSYPEVGRRAVEECLQNGNCLVIVNTKEAARQVYRACDELHPEERVHLSTDMCPAHRKEKLKIVLDRVKNKQRVVCVSTQLIEAGVDVDFRIVIRSLAGLDSIAQAAGRCNRNGDPAPGRVLVMNLKEEKLSMLPELILAQKEGARLLADFAANPTRYRDNLSGPEAMADYYRNYFFARKEEMSYVIGRKELGHDDTLLNLYSENKHAWEKLAGKGSYDTRLHFRQGFQSGGTAFRVIDSPTRGIVVPYGDEGKKIIGELCAAFEVKKQFSILRRAQQFSVNVFPHVLEKLNQAGNLYQVQPEVPILYLGEGHYSEDYGLSVEQVEEMELMNV